MNDRTPQIKRVLITGANGSAGRYLCEYLRANHPQIAVYGTARNKNSVTNAVDCVLVEADLADIGSLVRALLHSLPDVIFHLAANPDKGFEIPSAIIQNNAVGTVNLFEAVRLYDETGAGDSLEAGIKPVIVSASSSEVYGDVRPEDVPIKETCPFRPVSPYAVSKAAQDHLGQVYYKAYGMRIITTRAFSYNNFYRTNLFTSDLRAQIALIEAGKLDVLKHGNLDSVRVLCDARDIARAYWLAATRCRFGEAYNIGGDCRVMVGEVLRRLIGLSNLGLNVRCEQTLALMRPTDVTLQIPDSTKFRSETDWSPQFDLERSLADLLNYWRKEVAKG